MCLYTPKLFNFILLFFKTKINVILLKGRYFPPLFFFSHRLSLSPMLMLLYQWNNTILMIVNTNCLLEIGGSVCKKKKKMEMFDVLRPLSDDVLVNNFFPLMLVLPFVCGVVECVSAVLFIKRAPTC